MPQYLLTIENKSKGKKLMDFLSQLDFVNIKDISSIENEIKTSFSELKSGKISAWKNKKIQLKDV